MVADVWLLISASAVMVLLERAVKVVRLVRLHCFIISKLDYKLKLFFKQPYVILLVRTEADVAGVTIIAGANVGQDTSATSVNIARTI